MNTDFKDVMSKRTDEELIKIVTIDREGYQPLAVAAAEEEIENRKLDTAKIEQVESEFKAEIEEKKQIDDKTVSSLIRFVHFIIDTIVWFILAFILASILDILFNTSEEFVMLIAYLTLFVTFIGYYYIMEVSFQKTVAKFITKTKVVTNNGIKPSKSDILIRTFCRFVPLDQVSYLFTRNGFHDRFSNTRIIKDNRNER